MKKLLSLLLCMMLVFPLIGRVSAEETVIPIRSRQDLEAIQENPQGSYRLEADINLIDSDWVPIPFEGKLDGNDHVIYNLRIKEPGIDSDTTVDGNNKRYETYFAALFSVTRNAEIKDLKILGAEVYVDTDVHCFAAILAGFLQNTHIENCDVEGRVSLNTTNVCVGVGGLAGFGTGEIKDCRVDVSLSFADRSDRTLGLRCEQFMGGILACGNASLYDNAVKIKGFDSCWGFVHNGGLMGMFYRWDPQHSRGEVCNNTVNGMITFFENNPNRRAYCAPFIGEPLTYPSKMMKNIHNFTRNELYRQTQEMADHNCSAPDFELIPNLHEDNTWGYLIHRCKTCGYEYKTDYQAPGHVISDWEVTEEADYEHDGMRIKTCEVCGSIMEEEIIPAKIASNIIILSEKEVKLHYKDTVLLKAHVRPKNADNQKVKWISSDSSVVSVDADGNLTGHKTGSAIITCKSDDGFSTSSCPVEVTYSPLQWIIKIFLFGWIWY